MEVFTVIYPNGVKHGLYRFESDAAAEAKRLTEARNGDYNVKKIDLHASSSAYGYIK